MEARSDPKATVYHDF